VANRRRITIFDTTLRDGEQSPGIVLSPDEKAEIALALERLGYRLTILIVLLVLAGIVEKRGWIAAVVFAAGFSLGTHFLFNTLLRVPLPHGPFGL